MIEGRIIILKSVKFEKERIWRNVIEKIERDRKGRRDRGEEKEENWWREAERMRV